MNYNRYYVYAWIDPKTNIIFYIGKGTDRRKSNFHQSGRCENKRQKLLKEGWTNDEIICVIRDGLEESEAIKLERDLIGKYRRIEDGGTLFNYKIGGKAGYKIIDKQIINSIINEYTCNRKTAKEIGEMYNLHEASILRYLRLAGVATSPRGSRFKFTEEEVQHMKSLRDSGMSYNSISKIYKCSLLTIKNWINKT